MATVWTCCLLHAAPTGGCIRRVHRGMRYGVGGMGKGDVPAAEHRVRGSTFDAQSEPPKRLRKVTFSSTVPGGLVAGISTNLASGADLARSLGSNRRTAIRSGIVDTSESERRLSAARLPGAEPSQVFGRRMRTVEGHSVGALGATTTAAGVHPASDGRWDGG